MIGQIYPSKLRLAENTDTRLDIRRHDPDQEHGSDGQDENQNDDGMPYDETTVSIEALRVFLENFIQSSALSAGHADGYKPGTINMDRARASSQTHKAAQAYKHTAQTTSPDPRIRTQGRSAADSSAQLPLMSTEDVRTIEGLLRDLRVLEGSGIQTLKIEKSDTFLNSLVSSVQAIRH